VSALERLRLRCCDSIENVGHLPTLVGWGCIFVNFDSSLAKSSCGLYTFFTSLSVSACSVISLIVSRWLSKCNFASDVLNEIRPVSGVIY
jgi:hypothetical protein